GLAVRVEPLDVRGIVEPGGNLTVPEVADRVNFTDRAGRRDDRVRQGRARSSAVVDLTGRQTLDELGISGMIQQEFRRSDHGATEFLCGNGTTKVAKGRIAVSVQRPTGEGQGIGGGR